MVQLFLSEPIWHHDRGDENAELTLSLLDKLESALWSLLSHGSRAEARLWLCKTISGITSITPRNQAELFFNLLRSEPAKGDLVAQLLQLFFVRRPHKAGLIIAKKRHRLENFFKGNPKRILKWFASSTVDSGMEQSKGARALSHFAFVHRDICWGELEWKGKHGQSPAMVATKPHYFLDLDIQQTVENFLEYVPEFWSSDEFAESLKGGEILSIDGRYFVDLFVNLLYTEDSRDVWNAIEEFLREEPFSSLCHHLLTVLEERHLCAFLDLIRKYLESVNVKGFDSQSFWLEFILLKCSDPVFIDQLIMLNAVVNQGRQLLRLLRDEECWEEDAKIKDISNQVLGATNNTSFSIIMKDHLKVKNTKVLKHLGLLSWIFHYRMSNECHSPECWESVFITNGISFKKSDTYGLIHHDDLVGESGSDVDDRASNRANMKKEKRRNRKKRRRDFVNDDELPHFNMLNKALDLPSINRSWLLSTDGYSTSWSSADLPEHLSRHCFSTWMKWLFTKWSG